jgi:Icc-related predicted phosphoesterase
MKIVAVSDLHGNLPDLPQCDVVCICGDIMPLYIQKNYSRSISWLAGPFQSWALNLPCEKVIMIWGNHDFIGERLYKYGANINDDPKWVERMSGEAQADFLFMSDEDGKIRILCDEKYEFNGRVFYGTSWCPDLSRWAFYADSDTLKENFSKIPYETHVLLTHCPPKYGQQGVVLETNWNFGRDFGCEELQEAIEKAFMLKSSTTHILSGHVHSGNHNWEGSGGYSYRNVSLLNEDYGIAYKPLEFELH